MGGPGRLKTSFHEHLRGEETVEGRDYCRAQGGASVDKAAQL